MDHSLYHSSLSYIHSYGIGARVGIVGSRDYTSSWLVRGFVASLPGDCVVVSGNGGIVDTTAIDTAKKMGIAYTEYNPNWSYHKHGAGVMRNKKIAQDGLCCLVAFISSLANPSYGSYHTIQVALAVGVPVFMFGPADDFTYASTVDRQLCLNL